MGTSRDLAIATLGYLVFGERVFRDQGSHERNRNVTDGMSLEGAYQLAEGYLATGQYEAASRVVAALLNADDGPEPPSSAPAARGDRRGRA